MIFVFGIVHYQVQVELLPRMFHINVHELNFSKHIIQSIIHTINKTNNITNVASLTKYNFIPQIQNVFQFFFRQFFILRDTFKFY